MLIKHLFKMKSFLFSSICVILITFNACSQSKPDNQKMKSPTVTNSTSNDKSTIAIMAVEQKALEAATMQFIEGADKSDVAALDAVIHAQYRVVMNRLFGDAVTTMDKPTYLQLIADKKIGGTPRLIKIIAVSVMENIAAVELMTSSPKAEIHSFLHFIKEPDGKWRLVSDLPFMKSKG